MVAAVRVWYNRCMRDAGLPITVAVWGLALGTLLWGSGADMAVLRYLDAGYSQNFNDMMRMLGWLALGRNQIIVCLMAGVWLAAAPVARMFGWRKALVMVPRWILGCFDQLFLLLRGHFGWSHAWMGVSLRARVFLLAVPTMALAGLLGIVLKLCVGRVRPKEVMWNGGDAYGWHPLSFDAVHQSFPSGHSVSTFAIFTLLACAFPRWRMGIYGVAAAFAASRFLAVTPHYMGDTVAGAGVGAAVGLYVAARMKVRG